MTDLSAVAAQLKQERSKLDRAIVALSGVARSSGGGGRRKFSAAARERMAAAQRKGGRSSRRTGAVGMVLRVHRACYVACPFYSVLDELEMLWRSA